MKRRKGYKLSLQLAFLFLIFCLVAKLGTVVSVFVAAYVVLVYGPKLLK